MKNEGPAALGQRFWPILYGLTVLSLATALSSCGPERVEMPRFPHNTAQQTQTTLAVFYSPDDIDAASTIEDLGWPDDKLFRLHHDFPELKVTMQSIPYSRYIEDEADRYVLGCQKEATYPGLCCASMWRAIAAGELFGGCMELGNHGYSHAPPGDPEVDHKEFKEADNPLATSDDFCHERFSLAREAYRALGIPDGAVLVMRFPGHAQTEAALRALLDNGFIAFFGPEKRRYRERWVRLSDGREILDIPSSIRLLDYYQRKLSLKELDRCARKGGIVNLFDHWWEMFRLQPDGRSNYEVVKKMLDYLKERHKDGIWWPFGSELALWLQFKRQGSYEWRAEEGAIHIQAAWVEWNPDWRPIQLSFIVHRLQDRRIETIRYIDEKGRTSDLAPRMYWVEGGELFLNVPFQGRVSLSIETTGGADSPH